MARQGQGLVGPWVHKYPSILPSPSRGAGFSSARPFPGGTAGCAMSINGRARVPQMRAYILDGPRPALLGGRPDHRLLDCPRTRWDGAGTAAFNLDAAGRISRTGSGQASGTRHPGSPRFDTGVGRVSGSKQARRPNWRATSRNRRCRPHWFRTAHRSKEGIPLPPGPAGSSTIRPDQRSPIANLCGPRIVARSPRRHDNARLATAGTEPRPPGQSNADPRPWCRERPTDIEMVLDASAIALRPATVSGYAFHFLLAAIPLALLRPTAKNQKRPSASKVKLGLPLSASIRASTVAEPQSDADPLPRYEVARQRRQTLHRGSVISASGPDPSTG